MLFLFADDGDEETTGTGQNVVYDEREASLRLLLLPLRLLPGITLCHDDCHQLVSVSGVSVEFTFTYNSYMYICIYI